MIKEKIVPNLVVALFFILCFQDILQNKITILKIMDESVTISLLALLIIKILKCKKINKESFVIMINCMILITIGLIGSLLFEYQNINYSFQDILAVFKSIIAYVCFSNFILLDDNKWYIYKLNNLVRFFSIILFILSIINVFIPIFPYFDYRFGKPK